LQLLPPITYAREVVNNYNMKLTIPERITLLQVLPKEGNFVTLKVLRKLKGLLGFSEEDYKKFNIKQTGDRISWNKQGGQEVEIEIGEKAAEIIKEALLGLDGEKKLKPEHFSVYEKFVQEKEESGKAVS